jgi:hypothetical protein
MVSPVSNRSFDLASPMLNGVMSRGWPTPALITRKPTVLSFFALGWKSVWTVTPRYIKSVGYGEALWQKQIKLTGDSKDGGNIRSVEAG